MRPKDSKGTAAELSRIEQIELDGGTLPIPEMSAPYLWDWLQEVGICERGDMGPKPLSSTEFQAWIAGTGRQVDAWEFKAIRAASRAFVSQAASEDTAPPFGDPEELADPEVVEQRMAQVLDGLSQPIKR